MNKFNLFAKVGISASRDAALPQMLALLGIVAMTLSWLIPNHYPPWRSFYNEFAMGIAIGLLAVSCCCLRLEFTPPRTVWVVAAISAIPWIHYFFGLTIFSGDAWVSTLYLTGFATSILIGNQWRSDNGPRLSVLLSMAALVSAVISSLIGLVQVLNGGVLGIWSIDGPVGMQAQGNLGQPNNLGTLIAMGGVGLLLLWEKQIVSKYFAISLLAVLVLGAGLTRSRTALLFGPVIMGGLLFFWWRNPGLLKTRVSLVGAATAAQWVIGIGWPLVQSAMLLPIRSTIVSRGVSTGRLSYWELFVRAVNERPWTGYGWLETGQAQYTVYDYPGRPQTDLFMEAHNLFVDLIVWCGYPLGGLLIGIIIYWAISRTLRVTTVDAACGLLVLGVVGCHSMTELPFHYAYFLLPAGLWIGVIEQSLNGNPVRPRRRWSFLPIASVGVLFLWVSWEYVVIEDDFRLARFEYLNIGQLKADQPAPEVHLLSNLAAYSRFHRVKPSAEMSEQDLEAMRDVVERYPYARVLYGYATALALVGRLGESRHVLLKIRTIHGDRFYDMIKRDLDDRYETAPSNVRRLIDQLPQASGPK